MFGKCLPGFGYEDSSLEISTRICTRNGNWPSSHCKMRLNSSFEGEIIKSCRSWNRRPLPSITRHKELRERSRRTVAYPELSATISPSIVRSRCSMRVAVHTWLCRCRCRCIHECGTFRNSGLLSSRSLCISASSAWLSKATRRQTRQKVVCRVSHVLRDASRGAQFAETDLPNTMTSKQWNNHWEG